MTLEHLGKADIASVNHFRRLDILNSDSLGIYPETLEAA
jgi:hypothetical protein